MENLTVAELKQRCKSVDIKLTKADGSSKLKKDLIKSLSSVDQSIVGGRKRRSRKGTSSRRRSRKGSKKTSTKRRSRRGSRKVSRRRSSKKRSTKKKSSRRRRRSRKQVGGMRKSSNYTKDHIKFYHLGKQQSDGSNFKNSSYLLEQIASLYFSKKALLRYITSTDITEISSAFTNYIDNNVLPPKLSDTNFNTIMDDVRSYITRINDKEPAINEQLINEIRELLNKYIVTDIEFKDLVDQNINTHEDIQKYLVFFN